MNDYMIETRNLTKKYGSQVSVCFTSSGGLSL